MFKKTATAIILASTVNCAFAQSSSQNKNLIIQEPELVKVVSTQKAIFGAFHLAPIVVPAAEQVGDIIDTETAVLVAGTKDCFPKLEPRKVASQLPAITIHSERGLAAALGVEALADADGEGRSSHSFILDFQDVQVQRVSLFQLRTTVKKNVPECDTVRPYIDATYKPQIKRQPVSKVAEVAVDSSKSSVITAGNKLPPVLVGMLYTGRRVIRIRSMQLSSSVADVSFGQKILSKLGLNAKFQMSAINNYGSTVDLIGRDIVPVAFAPAFIVGNQRQLADGRYQYEISRVEPERIEKAIKIAKQQQNSILLAGQLTKHLKAIIGMTEGSEYTPSANDLIKVDYTTLKKQLEYLEKDLHAQKYFRSRTASGPYATSRAAIIRELTINPNRLEAVISESKADNLKSVLQVQRRRTF